MKPEMAMTQEPAAAGTEIAERLQASIGRPAEILIVEDDADIAELIEYQLQRAGFRAWAVDTGEAGKAHLDHRKPDLVVLDLMLPGISGLDLLKWLRFERREKTLPVIVVSARGEEPDRLLGFELGADDYLSKPFSVRELLLRISSILSRTIPLREQAPVIASGPIQVSLQGHEVLLEGRPLDLTMTEFKLLSFLARNAGRTMSRGKLLQEVWNYSSNSVTRTLDTYVQRLRLKLGEHKGLIQTVRGVGYRLEKRSFGS